MSPSASSASRPHQPRVTCDVLTPGECRQGGKGLVIRHGVHASPFGDCLIASTARGICKLAFFDTVAARRALERELREDWPAAERVADDAAIAALARQVFAERGAGTRPPGLRLLLRGSAFRLAVWEALLAIPAGEIRSYQDIANAIGRPGATRAVASAIACNDIAYLIPCHRVIRADGQTGQYRWGAARKKALLAREAVAPREDGGSPV